MTEYIKQVVKAIQAWKLPEPERTAFLGVRPPSLKNLIQALLEELNRLDPRDFDPSSRYEFVAQRARMRDWVTSAVVDNFYPIENAERFLGILDHYMGEGAGAKTREFGFISDDKLKAIVARDYRELSLRTFPDGSWKSTVILAGSILESVLHDRLTKDDESVGKAMRSSIAPKKRRGMQQKDIRSDAIEDQWTLNDLIKVACDVGIISAKHERSVHEVLREYRNFVHPRFEVRADDRISEAHATASKGMLDVILDHLDQNQ